MQTRNKYDKDVYNGDIGRVHAFDFEEQTMIVRVEGRTVTYEWSECDELVHAYAISVHKSQGSEYPVVVVPVLTQHYMMLQRNLLYTAVTRARRIVVLVGTRKASNYGREAARMLATDLARAGVTIVSGLAKGIDTQVHRGAIDAGGRTLAVLGSGVDIIYPYENLKLAQDIVQHGALISEYPLGAAPEASNFPPRNRIISGLSRGVIVVEAGEQSGALITAAFAADQGRDVFAVPGSIFPRGSVGANRLIRDGATPVLSANDVLEALNLTSVAQHVEAQMLLPTDATEALLFEHVGDEATHVDEIGRAAGLPIATVSSTLAVMELKGLVRAVGGMNYVRAREAGPVYQLQAA
jgi:DNA processing protein